MNRSAIRIVTTFAVLFAALFVLPGCSLLPWEDSYGPYVLNNTDKPIHIIRDCAPGHATQRTGDSSSMEFDVAPHEMAYGSFGSYNRVDAWTIFALGQSTVLDERQLQRLADGIHVTYENLVVRVDSDGIHACKLEEANQIVQSAAFSASAANGTAGK
jgi:hypothetical protein